MTVEEIGGPILIATLAVCALVLVVAHAAC